VKKAFIILSLLLGISTFSASASAMQLATGTIFDYGDNWNYYQASGSEYNWKVGALFNTATLNSFDWNKASSVGQAAFGNYYNNDVTVKTLWTANTGLALQKSFSLNGMLNDAVLSFGVDNGAIVFVNGTEVKRVNAEGYGWQNEYTVNLDSSLFKLGENKIQVLAQDSGGGTWIDLKLAGNVAPVPEPSSMILGLLSLSGLLGFRKKRK